VRRRIAAPVEMRNCVSGNLGDFLLSVIKREVLQANGFVTIWLNTDSMIHDVYTLAAFQF
jgi:hypothetical protein